MSKDPWNWDESDLQALIGQSEDYHLEFKEASLLKSDNEATAKNLTKEVSAFANAEGGNCYWPFRKKS